MKKVLLSFAALALVASVYSCRETDKEKAEDKVEQMGDNLEDAAEDTGDAIEKAADDTGDAIENAADDVEDEMKGNDDM